jgi:hypothetical protein
MRRKKFHKPVVIQPGRIDRDRVVMTPAEAADILLHGWPNVESEARNVAMKACLDVLKGAKPPRVARDAFIAAAKDVRIFLGEKI